MALRHVNGDDSFCGNGHGLYIRSGDVAVGPDVVVLPRDAGEQADGVVLPRDAGARADEAAPAPIRIEPVLS